MAAAFKVHHYRHEIGRAGGTETISPALGDTDKTIPMLGTSKFMNGGSTSSTGIRHCDDMSGGVEITNTTTLTYDRISTSTDEDTYFFTQLIECLAASDDPAAVALVSDNTFTEASYTATAGEFTAQSLDTTPSDINQCVPFQIRGSCDDTTGNSNKGHAALYFDSSDNIQGQHAFNSGETTSIRVLVYEFGSDWTIHYGYDSTSSDTGTITLKENADLSGSDSSVSSWSNAAIWGTYRCTATAPASSSVRYAPGSALDEVDRTLDAAANTAQTHGIFVLEHDDLSVTRYSGSISSAGVTAVDITSAGLSSIDDAFAIVTHSVPGGDIPSNFISARITSTTNCDLFLPRAPSAAGTYELQIVDLGGIETSGVSAAVGQATETDTAQGITVEVGQVVAVGQSAETDTAFSVTALTEAIVALGIATEADTAQGITAAFPAGVVIGQAADIHTAFGITVVQPIAVAVGLASEANEAQGITPILPAFAAVGISVELSTALSVTPIQTIPYGSWFGDEAVTGGFSAETSVDATWTPDDSITGTWSES